MICNKCGKELARLKSKYCSEKCRNSYIASIRHTDLYKPKKNIDENSMRLIYSKSKCIQILMKDMSEEDALEYYEYNIVGAYMGEKTPIWCIDDL